MSTQTLDSARPRLRVFRLLDQSSLSKDFIETVGPAEGTLPYVDHDLSRDLPWTQEIQATTIGAALVDEHGDIVAEFDGPDGWRLAEQAKDSARITFSLEVEQARKAPRAAKVEKAEVVRNIEPEVDDEDFAG